MEDIRVILISAIFINMNKQILHSTCTVIFDWWCLPYSITLKGGGGSNSCTNGISVKIIVNLVSSVLGDICYKDPHLDLYWNG